MHFWSYSPAINLNGMFFVSQSIISSPNLLNTYLVAGSIATYSSALSDWLVLVEIYNILILA